MRRCLAICTLPQQQQTAATATTAAATRSSSKICVSVSLPEHFQATDALWARHTSEDCISWQQQNELAVSTNQPFQSHNFSELTESERKVWDCTQSAAVNHGASLKGRFDEAEIAAKFGL